ncbi:MAG: hypothetical protein IJS72_03120 [Oscillospiraceae bacterium]|nr:hypothetical protein [Oscillospiraceae bacterium]
MSFAYDELYRTVKVTNEDGTNTEYTYDAAGKRLSITYPDGKAVTTTYDELGRVLSLTDHDGTGILYTRDAEGRVTKESYTDGSTTEYAYNAAGLLTLQKEVTRDNETLRQIVYTYDDAGNLTSENRSGVGIERKDERVRYSYDKADQLVKTNVEGEVKTYTYDKAGNLLSDGESTYTYDLQNRLVTKTNADGTTTYSYDKAGNLLSDGTTNYTYSAQNKLVRGEKVNGESSEYVYNALGVRIANTQIRENNNAKYQNSGLKDGSHGTDYLRFLKGGRSDWQRVWETEIGTTVQSDKETVTRRYVVDYLSTANRDIFVTEDGSYTSRYVYDANGRRISAEFDYAPGTKRGEAGENLQSDIAVSIGKVFYRTSNLGSTLFAVDRNGNKIAHAIYDPWGKPLTETYTDANYSGLENLNNFTGYTYDITLALYFAQNRFYDAETHRFTQEDTAKDGTNWYVYCGNSPVYRIDLLGTYSEPLAIHDPKNYVDLKAIVEQYGGMYLEYSNFPEKGAGVMVSIEGISKFFTALFEDNDGAYYDSSKRKMLVDPEVFRDTFLKQAEQENRLANAGRIKYDNKNYKIYVPLLYSDGLKYGYANYGSNAKFALSGYKCKKLDPKSFTIFDITRFLAGKGLSMDDNPSNESTNLGNNISAILSVINWVNWAAENNLSFSVRVRLYEKEYGNDRYATIELQNDNYAGIIKEYAGKYFFAPLCDYMGLQKGFVRFSFDSARENDQYLHYLYYVNGQFRAYNKKYAGDSRETYISKFIIPQLYGRYNYAKTVIVDEMLQDHIKSVLNDMGILVASGDEGSISYGQ